MTSTETRPTDDDARPSELSTAHLELHQVLLGTETLTEVLDRIAHLAKSTIPEVDEVSVTLVEGARARTAVFTSDLAVQLDERQYRDGFGPCLDAARTGRIVQVADTSDDRAYPDFASQALRSGVTRTLSTGLPLREGTVGALNIYGRSGHGWDDLTVAMADGFAAHAAVALANASLYARMAQQVEQMREAMASRSVIEQAKGMVMAARRCTPDEAFAELTRMSSHGNRKVRHVAAEVVAGFGDPL